jgi:hypothetical protein
VVDFYSWFISKYPLVILTVLANQDTRTLLPHSLEEIHQQITAITLPSSSNNQKKSQKSSPKQATSYDQQKLNQFQERWKRNEKLPEVKRCTSSSGNKTLKDAKRDIFMLDCNDNHKLDGQIVTMKELETFYYPFSYVYPEDIDATVSNTETLVSNIDETLPRHVKSFAGATEGYWKDLEPKGKRFMLINMEDGNIVRNSGKQGEELKAADVNGKFPILDGIDYKSNNAGHSLIYMEV